MESNDPKFFLNKKVDPTTANGYQDIGWQVNHLFSEMLRSQNAMIRMEREGKTESPEYSEAKKDYEGFKIEYEMMTLRFQEYKKRMDN